MARREDPPKKKKHPHAAFADLLIELVKPYAKLAGKVGRPDAAIKAGLAASRDPEATLRTLKNIYSIDDPVEPGLGERETEAAIGAAPVLGELQGVRDVVRDVRAKRYGWAGVNAALASIPFIGSVGPVARRVKAAALKYPDGTIVQGQHHGEARAIAEKQGLSGHPDVGFVDDQGKYLTRDEAAKISQEQKQLSKRALAQKDDPGRLAEDYAPGELGVSSRGPTDITGLALPPGGMAGDNVGMSSKAPSEGSKRLYHGTDKAFDDFRRAKDDIGIHFGTAEQANERLRMKAAISGSTEGHRVIPTDVKITNPVRLRDLGDWSWDNVRDALDDAGVATPEELQKVRSARDVRRVLKAHGYDGIVYQNKGEGYGLAQAYKEEKRLLGEAQNVPPEHPAYQRYLAAKKHTLDLLAKGADDSYIALEPSQIEFPYAAKGMAGDNVGIRFTDAAKARADRLRAKAQETGSLADHDAANRAFREWQSALGKVSTHEGTADPAALGMRIGVANTPSDMQSLLPPFEPPRPLKIVPKDRVNSDIVAAHNEHGGSTFDPRTGKNLAGSDRWAVATKKWETFDQAPTPEQIAAFREKHAKELAKPGREIGTWFDKEGKRHGKHELNITETYATKDEALKVGKARGEASILHLDPDFNFPEVDIEYTVHERAQRRAQDAARTKATRDARTKEIEAALRPQELAQFRRQQATIEDMYSRAPDPRAIASQALLGASQRGWYEASAKALNEAFGNDAPRFTALLSAQSPQKSVQQNFKDALTIWGKWLASGRSTDPDVLTKIMQDNGTPATLIPGSNRSLSLSDDEIMDPKLLEGGMLDGPKTDAFWANLMGETQRFTFDTHMARGSGTIKKAGDTVSRSLALTAAHRNAAKLLSEKLGRPVSTAEMQEMSWAAYKALSEMTPQGKTFEQVLKEKGPDAVRAHIAATPSSFGSLMQQEPFMQMLKDVGAKVPTPHAPTGLGDFDPALIRPKDLTDMTQRMDASKEGKYLFSGIPLLMLPAWARYRQQRERQQEQ